MNRKLVKEVYDGYILDIHGRKHYYKDNYRYKQVSEYGVFYLNELGQYHRLDGPAVEYTNSSYKEYWLEGKIICYVDWCEKVKEYADF